MCKQGLTTMMMNNDYGDHGHGYTLHRDMIKKLVVLEPHELNPVVFFGEKKM